MERSLGGRDPCQHSPDTHDFGGGGPIADKLRLEQGNLWKDRSDRCQFCAWFGGARIVGRATMTDLSRRRLEPNGYFNNKPTTIENSDAFSCA